MAGPMRRLGPAAIKGAKMREMLERAERAAPGVSEPAAERVMRRAEMYAPGVRPRGMKKGGMSCYKKGGVIDGIAKKGKTRCRMV
jgi:hypothetical protein